MTANTPDSSALAHPRRIGWLSTTALAMGGSNQSLFLIGALIAGQGGIPGQGSAVVPLLLFGLILGWAAAPGWIELILMWPNRVGGIAATCAEAFRPYSPVLAALAGVCYWWGWVPTCGLTALFSASAIHAWYLPGVPIPLLAALLVSVFTLVNLCGVGVTARLAIPSALISAALALLSAIIPVVSGHMDWHRATTFSLTVPFPGLFGGLTSIMAGLYLIGFAAPAFEAATCHVGETVDPARNVPRAVFASAAVATLYFAVLPIIWLGALGVGPLTGDLNTTLGPTYAPLLGTVAHTAALWFMMFNMFHGTLQPLAGAARTLMQLAEDGLLPRILALRTRTDAPLVATLLTAAMAVAFLLVGDPLWMLAAANLAYLIGICLPSVAVWLLRRDAPAMTRPFRAPRGTIGLGLCAVAVWLLATVLGFQQFGMLTVLAGLALVFSGPLLYMLRRWTDRGTVEVGGVSLLRSLHVKLTGAMLAVLLLDASGYLLAVNSAGRQAPELITVLEDIFVLVAVLTVGVGLILPGMIAHAVGEVARAADHLAKGTLADLARAMQALGSGNLDAAIAQPRVVPVIVHTQDEVGAMAASFNAMQEEIAQACVALAEAREGVRGARQELATLAMTDALTGLANRTLLADRLDHALAAARRSGRPMALLLLDLDRFKEVNDAFGHHHGDRLIVEVAVRLRATLREADTAARLGGDEFAIVLPDCDLSGAESAAQRILAALDRAVEIEGESLTTGASVGVSLFPTHGQDEEALMRQADVAMYVAKRHHRGYVVYDPGHDEHTRSRLALMGDLRHAFESDGLLLYYQPKVDASTGRLAGVEALLRWPHPVHGFIPPDRFLPMAESLGLIGPLTSWVLETALRQFRAWQDAGRAVAIAVNLSMRSLHDQAFPATVEELLARYAVPPGELTLEITEGALMAEPALALDVLTRLGALGVHTSIDDFGTGYSSLGYLKRLPVHEVKIDKAFVQGIAHSAKDTAIVRAVIVMAHALNLTVVAEGVEDEATRTVLDDLGCDTVQGYHICRPVPPGDLVSWLDRSAPLTLAR